jgi:phospholipase C
MVFSTALPPIEHIFILMLENRSFDHMLGFSEIVGFDAVNGEPTKLNGLLGTESNSFNGVSYSVMHPADLVMPVDPAHEFLDVLKQLCGPAAKYSAASDYPFIDCSGFVANYVANGGLKSPGEIMKCYHPTQLPVLMALASEFAICDNWYSSLPGPTWPNRFFAHAASSGGLDHSPTIPEMMVWEEFAGFRFQNGTIYDSLQKFDFEHGWRIYSDGYFPNVAALKGIKNFAINNFVDFKSDLTSSTYPWHYTFIEPNYGDIIRNTYRNGTSQHPLDDVTHGEGLIKTIYESIRTSPIWENSLLIITWDEHGGFYDHVRPPKAVSPNDSYVTKDANQFGFTFQQYGPRVPAIVISPLIPKNRIDHRIYDHASIPATIESLFGLSPLTCRDAQANNLLSLASLSRPRSDAPKVLPNPLAPAEFRMMDLTSPSAATLSDPIDRGNLPGFLQLALKSDLALSRPEDRAAILASFNAIKTRAEAMDYMNSVEVKVQAGRAATKHHVDLSLQRQDRTHFSQ